MLSRPATTGPIEVPAIGVAWIPLPAHAELFVCAVRGRLAVGAVEVGVLAVAATVSVGTVVAVMVGVSSGKIPFAASGVGPHHEGEPDRRQDGQKARIRANRAVGELIPGPGT